MKKAKTKYIQIRLSEKEYSFLEMLADKVGKTVTGVATTYLYGIMYDELVIKRLFDPVLKKKHDKRITDLIDISERVGQEYETVLANSKKYYEILCLVQNKYFKVWNDLDITNRELEMKRGRIAMLIDELGAEVKKHKELDKINKRHKEGNK